MGAIRHDQLSPEARLAAERKAAKAREEADAARAAKLEQLERERAATRAAKAKAAAQPVVPKVEPQAQWQKFVDQQNELLAQTLELSDLTQARKILSARINVQAMQEHAEEANTDPKKARRHVESFSKKIVAPVIASLRTMQDTNKTELKILQATDRILEHIATQAEEHKALRSVFLEMLDLAVQASEGKLANFSPEDVDIADHVSTQRTNIKQELQEARLAKEAAQQREAEQAAQLAAEQARKGARAAQIRAPFVWLGEQHTKPWVLLSEGSLFTLLAVVARTLVPDVPTTPAPNPDQAPPPAPGLHAPVTPGPQQEAATVTPAPSTLDVSNSPPLDPSMNYWFKLSQISKGIEINYKVDPQTESATFYVADKDIGTAPILYHVAYKQKPKDINLPENPREEWGKGHTADVVGAGVYGLAALSKSTLEAYRNGKASVEDLRSMYVTLLYTAKQMVNDHGNHGFQELYEAYLEFVTAVNPQSLHPDHLAKFPLGLDSIIVPQGIVFRPGSTEHRQGRVRGSYRFDFDPNLEPKPGDIPLSFGPEEAPSDPFINLSMLQIYQEPCDSDAACRRLLNVSKHILNIARITADPKKIRSAFLSQQIIFKKLLANLSHMSEDTRSDVADVARLLHEGYVAHQTRYAGQPELQLNGVPSFVNFGLGQVRVGPSETREEVLKGENQ